MFQYSPSPATIKAPYSRKDSLYVSREQWFQIYKAYKASHLSRSVFFNTKLTLLFPEMKGVGRTTFYDHVSRIDMLGESKFQLRLQSSCSNNDYWDKTYQAYLDSGTNVLMEYFSLLMLLLSNNDQNFLTNSVTRYPINFVHYILGSNIYKLSFDHIPTEKAA